MNNLLKYMFVLLIASFGTSVTFAAEFSPVIPAPYGIIHSSKNLTYLPQKNIQHKAVFAISQNGQNMGDINDGLNHVAKTINLYAFAGIPVKDLTFVAVIYGPATPIALNNQEYFKKFGVNNPNIKLIEALKKANVSVVVCSQAWHEHDFQPEWLNKDVPMALSALTTIIELQLKGFALMQF